MGEAIEIAMPAGTNLATLSLYLYNGSPNPAAAAVYSSQLLSNTANTTAVAGGELWAL